MRNNNQPMRLLLFILIALTSCKASNLPPDAAVKKLGSNPYIEIDGNPQNMSDIQSYDPNQIASANTYYGKEATKKFGEKAKDGAIIFESKRRAKEKYQAFFTDASKDYREIIKEFDEETEIQYILNDRVLVQKFEGDLATINKKRLKSITIINQEDLAKIYNVKDKKIGVLIKAKPPKDLYNSKEKF